MNAKKLEVLVFILFVNDFEDKIKNELKDGLQKSWPLDGHNFFKGKNLIVRMRYRKINNKE